MSARFLSGQPRRIRTSHADPALSRAFDCAGACPAVGSSATLGLFLRKEVPHGATTRLFRIRTANGLQCRDTPARCRNTYRDHCRRFGVGDSCSDLHGLLRRVDSCHPRVPCPCCSTRFQGWMTQPARKSRFFQDARRASLQRSMMMSWRSNIARSAGSRKSAARRFFVNGGGT